MRNRRLLSGYTRGMRRSTHHGRHQDAEGRQDVQQVVGVEGEQAVEDGSGQQDRVQVAVAVALG
ncbi:hypothetical protein SF12_12695 [Streptomyces sp. MBRL 601]|uniref:Uncharacterized protein n=1 Tax=Streptomyces koyangensis TaxID=188770 RepID=A0A385DF87_9ACTN|nr:hypothetical protein D0C37_22200 [Streptomyces koyangensis]KIX77674.1 hypothetical protein SF12_12695 [Streptomyces sp. MBRL 601]